MTDIFKNHNKKKKIVDKMYFYAFYTLLLYLFALLLVSVSKENTICIFDFCAHTKNELFFSGFLLYVYLLGFVILVIQTYKLLEKLVAKKDFIRYFRWIFYLIPIIVVIILWLLDTDFEDGLLLFVFSAIISLVGLLLIELRKKK